MDQGISVRKALLKLSSLGDQELDAVRGKLSWPVPEMTIVSKVIEAAWLLEFYRRTHKIDLEIASRVFYTIDDPSIFSCFQPLSRSSPRELCSAERLDNVRVLILGSKFGDYVSSQEVSRQILRNIDPSCHITLASRRGFSHFYNSHFDCFFFRTIGELFDLCRSNRFDKVVDLTGDYKDCISALRQDIHYCGLYSWPFDRCDSHLYDSTLSRYVDYMRSPYDSGQAIALFYPSLDEDRLPQIRLPRWADGTGVVNLGAFSRTSKLNLRSIELYSSVLKRFPNSILWFAYIQANANSEAYTRKLFNAFGIEEDRVRFYPRMSTNTYLDAFNDMDLCLGAMPEQGGVSCLDSLIMGVPYLVCNDLSNTYASTKILTSLGYTTWIVEHKDEFVDRVERLLLEMRSTDRVEERLSVRRCLIDSSFGTPETASRLWSDFMLLKV